MEAIERTFVSNNWITLLFLLAFVLLALMKLLKPKQLVGYCIAFFVQGFIKERSEKKRLTSYFDVYLFAFSLLILGLTGYLIIKQNNSTASFWSFLTVLTVILLYLAVRFFTTWIVVKTLQLRKSTRYYFASSMGYLYTVCLLLFPVLILYQYGLNNPLFFYTTLAILWLFRGGLILYNNKKLIFSQLFYFILYFCTLELAPLLILYKTTTT